MQSRIQNSMPCISGVNRVIHLDEINGTFPGINLSIFIVV